MSSPDSPEVGKRVLVVIRDMAPFRDVEVTPETRLREDLGFDSLSLLELAAALEDEFGLPGSAHLEDEIADYADDVMRIVAEKLSEAEN
jgi:acyl carrier protein